MQLREQVYSNHRGKSSPNGTQTVDADFAEPPSPHGTLGDVCTEKSTSWPGTPCESDAWPFMPNLADFEARRAVGQLARTIQGPFLDARNLDLSNDFDTIALYIYSANVLLCSMRDALNDLVAEARARDVSWTMIGKMLGVGKQAAHNKFHNGVQEERLELLKECSKVTQLTGQAAAGPYEGVDEALEDLQGTTPADRIKYSFKLISGAHHAFVELEAELLHESRDRDQIAGAIWKIKNKLLLLSLTIIPDPAQWDAVIEWAEQPSDPSSANYYAPATYIYYSMQQIQLLSRLIGQALDVRDDFNTLISFIGQARGVLNNLIFTLGRDDVQAAFSSSAFRAGINSED
jgi:hypothetical protein